MHVLTIKNNLPRPPDNYKCYFFIFNIQNIFTKHDLFHPTSIYNPTDGLYLTRTYMASSFAYNIF